MKLTKEQQNIMDNDENELLRWAMSCLYKYGNAMGADMLIPVSNVHTYVGTMHTLARIFTPPYVKLTAERIKKVKQLMSGLRVKVKTTSSPPPIFQKSSPEEASNIAFYDGNEVIENAKKLGIQVTLTCTPYLIGNVPVKGETCSWLESSAIVYINSMLGAHTNRDGVELTLFSALLGVTPRFGLHISENRRGTHLIHVKDKLTSLGDWGALGFFAGEVAGLGIPVFTNLERPTVEEAKQLCASVATSGGVSMLHIVGVTPEAETLEKAFGGNKPVEKLTFSKSDNRKISEHLNYDATGKVGLVFIGCPHATMTEITEIARLIEGRHIAQDTLLWIGADYTTISLADRQGTAGIIRSAGGKFVERCPISTSLDMTLLKRMATNSVKMAHYTVNDLQSKAFFGDLKECIDIAVKGGV